MLYTVIVDDKWTKRSDLLCVVDDRETADQEMKEHIADHPCAEWLDGNVYECYTSIDEIYQDHIETLNDKIALYASMLRENGFDIDNIDQ